MGPYPRCRQDTGAMPLTNNSVHSGIHRTEAFLWRVFQVGKKCKHPGPSWDSNISASSAPNEPGNIGEIKTKFTDQMNITNASNFTDWRLSCGSPDPYGHGEHRTPSLSPRPRNTSDILAITGPSLATGVCTERNTNEALHKMSKFSHLFHTKNARLYETVANFPLDKENMPEIGASAFERLDLPVSTD